MRHLSLAVRVCAVWLLVLALGAGAAWGQSGSSTIRGTVTDPQGAVVPGATVTITNPATNYTRSQTTSASGAFSFELIPPGRYRVEMKAQGFRVRVLNNVEALVGLPTDVSSQLEVGSIAETVQVEAASTAVQVNTQDATLGNNFVSQQILQLPMEARSIASLLTLQPGVTRTGYVAGARADQSNVTLDGVDINEQQNNQLFGTGADTKPVLRLNSEAIEEFRVTTVNSNANQGRSSGAQINLVTKGGTNDIHGSAFESHRNTIFTANDFFSNRSGTDRPKLIRNVYGGSIGGPIRKDKLFFFYSYEGRRDASDSTVTRIVPLPNMGQGIMRYKDVNGNIQSLSLAQMNAIFPEAGINPVALQALAAAAAAYPANDTSQGDNLNTSGFLFNAPTPVDLNSNVAKIDWNISSNMTMFARFNAIYDLQGQVPQFPDTPAPNLWEHPIGGVISHNWTFAHNWVNSFRYGYTKQAFSQQGDSSDNAITFRFVFSPRRFLRTISRTTPVHNIVNDTSWTKNNHTVQFGTNIRLVRNNRTTFAGAFDSAVTNPSFYFAAGEVLTEAIDNFLAANMLPAQVSTAESQNAATAMIGRFTQYAGNFTFALDGQLLPPGTPSARTFATEEYDVYVQDAWKVRRNLTISAGLRYSISRPVYETHGFEVKPDIPLNEYFRRRRAGAAAGVPYNELITLDLSGPANGRSPMYQWDRNNIQPRIAVAWTPDFKSNILQWFFGTGGKSVIRSGFAMTNDYYGQALTVNFDLNNTLGFTASDEISANTFDVTTSNGVPLGPLFTGYTQNVRPLPFITVPGAVSFPAQAPADDSRRIEDSLDEGLQAPLNYVWNLTLERELPHGFVVQASYTGRLGQNLLADRDVMALNNLVDPRSGMDWYTAATALEKIRQTRPPANTAVQPISYFENIFPSNLTAILNNCCEGSIPANFTPTQAIFWLSRNVWANDWTDTQDELEFALRDAGLFSNLFFNPQYGALSSFGTIAGSNYQGFSLAVRQRYRGLLWDFNYTWSHSFDDASGLQNSGTFGSSFILNPILQKDNRTVSDFDIRHLVNVNAIYELPFGRGKHFGGGMGRGADALVGGWQLSGIFRWNTGLPVADSPFDDARWATNWNAQSYVTLTRPISPCITKGNSSTPPKLFGCNTKEAYQSFRNAYPGETGMRNLFRYPGYVNIDLGLSKSFTMPYNERHKLSLSWQVFNVTNTQRFGQIDGSRSGIGIASDPLVRNRIPPANWSNFTSTQKPPGANSAGRVMQIGARFEF